MELGISWKYACLVVGDKRNPQFYHNLQLAITHTGHLFRLPLRINGMQADLMYLWSFYHLKSDHTCSDHLSHESYAKHSVGAKGFWRVTFGYYWVILLGVKRLQKTKCRSLQKYRFLTTVRKLSEY